MRRRSIAALILVVAAVVAAWILARRNAQPVPAIAVEAEPVRDGAKPSLAPAPARPAAPPPVRPASARAPIEPLPAEGTPLAAIADELAERARAGDNAAAMRLAFDLQRCSWKLGFTLDQAAERSVFCEGIDHKRIDARGEWLLLAADRGDVEAMTCYAAHPNDLGPKFLSDAWFDWSQRWRDRAPAFAARAYELGQADLPGLLADAYSGHELHGMRVQHHAFTLLVQPDPARAAAYREISRRVSVGGIPPVPLPGVRGDVLSEIEQRRAQAMVDRDWPRFAQAPVDRSNQMPCIRLFRSMR